MHAAAETFVRQTTAEPAQPHGSNTHLTTSQIASEVRPDELDPATALTGKLF